MARRASSIPAPPQTVKHWGMACQVKGFKHVGETGKFLKIAVVAMWSSIVENIPCFSAVYIYVIPSVLFFEIYCDALVSGAGLDDFLPQHVWTQLRDRSQMFKSLLPGDLILSVLSQCCFKGALHPIVGMKTLVWTPSSCISLSLLQGFESISHNPIGSMGLVYEKPSYFPFELPFFTFKSWPGRYSNPIDPWTHCANNSSLRTFHHTQSYALLVVFF